MPGGVGGGHTLPAGWVQPRPSDDLVDSVAVNVPWTNYDYRRPAGASPQPGQGNLLPNDHTVWGPQIRAMRIRYARMSYNHDFASGRPAWAGGGGGRTQNKTADRALFNYLERIGLRAGHCLWVGNSLATETYTDFLQGGYPVPAWFEGINEPPFFDGAGAIPLYTRYVGTNRGTITAGAAYAVGDYGQDPNGYNYTCIAATASLPAPEVPTAPTTGYWWGTNFVPSWARDMRWYHEVAAPALKAIPGWANVPIIGGSWYETYPAAQGPNAPRSFDEYIGRQLQGADGRNSHKYQLPGSANYDIPGQHLDQFKGYRDVVTGNASWYLTESTAYRGGPPLGYYTCPEQAQSTLTLRLIAYAFEVGVAKTVLWEACDEVTPWFADSVYDIEGYGGLISYTLQPKPVAVHLERLLTMCEDLGPRFTPRAVRPTFTGAPSDLGTTWLRRRNGDLILLFWLRRECMTDPTGSTASARGGRDAAGTLGADGDVYCNPGSYASGTYTASSVAITVAVGETAGQVELYRPDESAQPTATFGRRAAGATVSVTATERVQALIWSGTSP
jgi:hypothetical protein